MTNNVLSVRRLNTAYGKVQVLNHIDLDVKSGTIVTVIGPNGAGKTTLLSSIMGVLPSVGEIVFDDQHFVSPDIGQMVAARMTLVPEKRELFGEMSVEDNLLLGGFQRVRAGDKTVRETLREVYDLFPRLLERRQQLAATLSGGERQMLAVGRALMAKPKLLMLDEPSLGLAPRIVREIFKMIAELRRRGVSILLVEQNARAALQVADYGYVLENGDIKMHGPAKELAHDPRVVAVYLGLNGQHQDKLVR